MSDDWDSTTVLRKRSDHTRSARTNADLNAARRAGAVVDTGKKFTGGRNAGPAGTDGQLIAKIDRTDEIIIPKKVSLSLAKAIMQGRQAKGNMTQKALATLVNEKSTTINDYEAGRGTPNPVLLGRMERVLGIKLRGKDIGSPLGPPTKKK